MTKLITRHEHIAYIKGPALREMRKEKALTQKQLSERLKEATGIEIDHRRISELEKSFEFPVDSKMLVEIRKILF